MSTSLYYLCVLAAFLAASVGDVDISDQLDQLLNIAQNDALENEVTNEEKKNKGLDNMDVDDADNQLSMFDNPAERVKELARQAAIELSVLEKINAIDDISPHQLRVSPPYLRIWKQKFRKVCSTDTKQIVCDRKAIYRTADGSCNNKKYPLWGATFQPELREIPPMYDDGVNSPRQRDRLGGPLPSARLVSNVVHHVTGRSPRNSRLSVMVMQWGQFIDHEFVATPVLKGANGTGIKCCSEENNGRPECFPISIPKNDQFFSKDCMSFVRSAPVPSPDCSPGYREQVNQVTSFIDGSAVYGSTAVETEGLRRMEGGLLKTADDHVNVSECMLPKNTPDKCVLESKDDYCQLAGDGRVNVVPSLGTMHTTFLRAHNTIATQLTALNPHWDDERTFQETRRIIAAIEQIITYKEYLPAILNKATRDEYDLDLEKTGYKYQYRSTTNPTIANVFAAAAFRFGHSQIANYQGMMDKGYVHSESLPIEDTYHNPELCIHAAGKQMTDITRWLTADRCPLADGLFEDGVRNKLFQDKHMNSLDLAALNIQRGRDHGLPSYNHWRVHCRLAAARMTDDGHFMLPDHDADQTAKLELVYRHVDDIDLFSGAMTETLLENSSVGPTFACLLGRQFKRLKRGDRFWHETPSKQLRFNKAQLAELRKVSLAKVLCDCFQLDSVQPDVFTVPGPGNERVSCDTLPAMDFTKWSAYPTKPGDRPRFKRSR